jgi:hypothetical protein
MHNEYLRKYCQLTKPLRQSSWDTDTRSAGQKINRLLWNPKFHYHVHKTPPLDPILNLLNLVHTVPPNFSKVKGKVVPVL